MKSNKNIDAKRLKHPISGEHGDDLNGCFLINSPTRKTVALLIIQSNGGGWDHISISGRIMGKIKTINPTWSEMCHIKDLFFNDDETVVQFHPEKTSYVNVHNNCLHLWRDQENGHRLPDIGMV